MSSDELPCFLDEKLRRMDAFELEEPQSVHDLLLLNTSPSPVSSPRARSTGSTSFRGTWSCSASRPGTSTLASAWRWTATRRYPTPSVSNRSHVPSQVATSYKQFDLKLHVKIQPAIVNYYGKQQFNCIASVDTADGNTTTKSTLIKLRRLINSIHYLAKDDAHVLAWCKTTPTQRSSDWTAMITLKSIELQETS